MTLERVTYRGHEMVRIRAGAVAALGTIDVGPRILGLVLPDGRDLLAHLPDVTLECPGSGPNRLYGGHRLWTAPEDPALTYRPDDDPVTVEELPDGVRLTGPADPVAGTRRGLSIEAAGEGRLRIGHRVENTSDRVLRLAPWGITLVPHGGRAWLPLAAAPIDGGSQAERNLVLWAYTRLSDPRLAVGDRMVEVRTDGPGRQDVQDRLKVGTSIRRGWLANWGDGALFVKRARHVEGAAYADLGATGQVYANGFSVELETLGPLVDLAPGKAVEHVEDWEVHLIGEAAAEELIESGGLDAPT